MVQNNDQSSSCLKLWLPVIRSFTLFDLTENVFPSSRNVETALDRAKQYCPSFPYTVYLRELHFQIVRCALHYAPKWRRPQDCRGMERRHSKHNGSKRRRRRRAHSCSGTRGRSLWSLRCRGAAAGDWAPRRCSPRRAASGGRRGRRSSCPASSRPGSACTAPTGTRSRCPPCRRAGTPTCCSPAERADSGREQKNSPGVSSSCIARGIQRHPHCSMERTCGYFQDTEPK